MNLQAARFNLSSAFSQRLAAAYATSDKNQSEQAKFEEQPLASPAPLQRARLKVDDPELKPATPAPAGCASCRPTARTPLRRAAGPTLGSWTAGLGESSSPPLFVLQRCAVHMSSSGLGLNDSTALAQAAPTPFISCGGWKRALRRASQCCCPCQKLGCFVATLAGRTGARGWPAGWGRAGGYAGVPGEGLCAAAHHGGTMGRRRRLAASSATGLVCL
jgi:hypothetical protein